MCDNDGQSTIEFLTSFIFVFGLLFMFIKIGINTTSGYVIHYATFMASRTYLVHDENSNNVGTGDTRAENATRRVFSEIIAQAGLGGITLEFNAPSFSGRKALVGVRAKFKQKFSFSKLIGGGKMMDMVSESYLGREPVRAECLDQVCDATAIIAGSNACESEVNGKTFSTLYDNGC